MIPLGLEQPAGDVAQLVAAAAGQRRAVLLLLRLGGHLRLEDIMISCVNDTPKGSPNLVLLLLHLDDLPLLDVLQDGGLLAQPRHVHPSLHL